MNKVYLISCTKSKQNYDCSAREMYDSSSLFRLAYAYAKSLAPDEKIFVISAKHYLLPLDDVISPYDVSLNNLRIAERRKWAGVVFSQLENIFNLNETTFVMLAGKKYSDELITLLPHTENPLKGMAIGIRMNYLKENTKC